MVGGPAFVYNYDLHGWPMVVAPSTDHDCIIQILHKIAGMP